MLNELIRNGWTKSEDHENCVYTQFRGSKLEVTCFPCTEDSRCGCVLIEVSNSIGDYQSANCGTTSTGYPSLLIEPFTTTGDFLTFLSSSINSGVKDHGCVPFNRKKARAIIDTYEMFNQEGV